TDSRRMRDQYAAELLSVFELYKANRFSISSAIVSSVVPIVTQSVAEAIRAVFDLEPLILGYPVYRLLDIKLDNPRELGCDLYATAVGALEKYPLPAVIIDMGTATKITAVSRSREFLGGAIMPGLRISTDALVDSTSLLPGVSFYAPERAISTNTPDCMMSGVVFGAAAMLDGMYERMCEELGERASAIITGGLASVVAPLCRTELIYDENLLLDGLCAILRNETN
ncbi:MAG: type III pantothenate kinase, partial [Oscillospiraceae bacterium]|nr:type III pantothenate kinase [Oscillospiraceae bacterium]